MGADRDLGMGYGSMGGMGAMGGEAGAGSGGGHTQQQCMDQQCVCRGARQQQTLVGGDRLAAPRTSFLIERASFSGPPSAKASSCDAAVEVIAAEGSTSVPLMSTSVLPSLLMSEPRLDVSENLDESSGCASGAPPPLLVASIRVRIGERAVEQFRCSVEDQLTRYVSLPTQRAPPTASGSDKPL